MPTGSCQGRLYFRLPQTVEIAVGIYGHSLVITQAEGHVGLFAGLEILALTAFFGLDIDPLDVVLISHRMIDAANVDMDCAVLNGNVGLHNGFTQQLESATRDYLPEFSDRDVSSVLQNMNKVFS